ncbi:MAG TPA: SUMF1/EgtB/PvdO family nonheme iron enzyme [Candidatus Bathyarchaeia archaeon]|nr:SUMF1/EgtB/PvdO family nonheme iron enzyme [Candidatus Bathyarchaeia archaeon]
MSARAITLNAVVIVVACILVGCPPSPPSTVTVPNCASQTQAAAQSAITSVGLSVGTVTQEHSDTVPEGYVISQDPVAGTKVAPGSAVDLVVSLGPEMVRIEVPGAEIVHEGEVYSDAVDVPGDALVGVVVDGEAYLYHPALPEGTALSEETSRKALGLWVTGVDALANKTTAKTIHSENELWYGTERVSTGIDVTHTDIGKFTFTNRARRWAAIYTEADPNNPIFLTPANRPAIVPNIGSILAQKLGFNRPDFSSREVTVDAEPIDTMGSFVRSPVSALYAEDVPDYAETTYVLLNLADFSLLLWDGVKLFLPVECNAEGLFTLALDEVINGQTGVLERDPDKLAELEQKLQNLAAQTVVTCLNDGSANGKALSNFLKFFSLLNYSVDEHIVGAVDTLRFDAYAEFPGYSELDLQIGDEEPAPAEVTLDASNRSFSVDVVNLGGWPLRWEATPSDGSLVTLNEYIGEAEDRFTVTITLDEEDTDRGGESTTIVFVNRSNPNDTAEIVVNVAQAQLEVSPPRLSLSRQINFETVTVTNNGNAVLNWMGESFDDDPIIEVDKTSGTLEPNESESVRFALRSPSTVSDYHEKTFVFVDEDNADARASVYVEVEPALLNVAVPQGGIQLDADNPSATVTVINRGLAPLSWQAEGYDGVTVTPFSGYLEPNNASDSDEETVTITANDPDADLSTVITFVNLLNEANTVEVEVGGCGGGCDTPGATETIMLPGDVPLKMVCIPAGTFMMGRYPGEQDSSDSEAPQHEVTITQGFWMGKYELTKRQWQAVMGTTPWSGRDYVLDDADSPAVYVSWNDAQAFITALNGLTGKTFRLPSEAEWEYACRAGTTTRFYRGDDPGYSVGDAYCWWHYNTVEVKEVNEQYAHIVGLKTANAFGLYDMSGNVWEWCQDWFDSYTSGSVTDPTGPASGSNRVVRGGGWPDGGSSCRSAGRGSSSPSYTFNYLGFRLSR